MGCASCTDEIARLNAEIEALRAANLRQMPDGMQNCTIVLKECILGHERLLASHWLDEGCLECAIDSLKLHLKDADD